MLTKTTNYRKSEVWLVYIDGYLMGHSLTIKPITAAKRVMKALGVTKGVISVLRERDSQIHLWQKDGKEILPLTYKIGPTHPQYEAILRQRTRCPEMFYCDAVTHNSNRGCKNSDCFKFKGKQEIK